MNCRNVLRSDPRYVALFGSRERRTWRAGRS